MAKKKPSKGSKPPQICKAILLCSHIMVDALTGKISVIDIQETWHFPRFPSPMPQVAAYLQMTDGLGKYEISVEVRDLQADEVIADALVADADFPERDSNATLFIPFPPLHLEHAGSYDFVVLADGQEVDRQQFQVVQTEGGTSDGLSSLPEDD